MITRPTPNNPVYYVYLTLEHGGILELCKLSAEQFGDLFEKIYQIEDTVYGKAWTGDIIRLSSRSKDRGTPYTYTSSYTLQGWCEPEIT